MRIGAGTFENYVCFQIFAGVMQISDRIDDAAATRILLIR